MAKLAEDEQAVFKSRLQSFMDKRSRDDPGQPLKKKGQDKESNQWFLLAFDQALEAGCGVSLAHFVPDEPLRALRPWETQYFLEEGASDMIRASGDLVGRRRSCVFDRRTGTSRFELPVQVDSDGVVSRPALHIASDDGPIGRPAMYYMMSELCIRCTRDRDQSHKKHNLTKAAALESGLWLTVLETTVGYNGLGRAMPFSARL